MSLTATISSLSLPPTQAPGAGAQMGEGFCLKDILEGRTHTSAYMVSKQPLGQPFWLQLS